jgi:hypothetical protein
MLKANPVITRLQQFMSNNALLPSKSLVYQSENQSKSVEVIREKNKGHLVMGIIQILLIQRNSRQR